MTPRKLTELLYMSDRCLCRLASSSDGIVGAVNYALLPFTSGRLDYGQTNLFSLSIRSRAPVISEATRDELLTLVVRQELDRSLGGLVTCR